MYISCGFTGLSLYRTSAEANGDSSSKILGLALRAELEPYGMTASRDHSVAR